MLLDKFKAEIEKRRGLFLNQKYKKEKLFQEIEHDKTQLRIIENRAEKSSASLAIKFPLKIEISLIKGAWAGTCRA